MKNIKYIKTFINEKFFDYPESIFKSRITAFKFGYLNNKINLIHPFLFVCNKVTPFDNKLISNTLRGNFVFLKDWVIQKMYEGKFSENDEQELLNAFKTLKDAFISVVVFPEKSETVFGKCSQLPKNITTFLHNTNYNIKFLGLVGTYFAMPIWSQKHRICDTRFHHQFTLKTTEREDLSENTINEIINHYMPSSASVYTYKFDPEIRSNEKADGLETIIYCCPKCKELLSIYSEFNCLKCKNCGTAVECSSNGRIALSNTISDLDNFSEFQYNVLKNHKFDNLSPIIEYNNINIASSASNLTLLVNIGENKLTILNDQIIINNDTSPVIYNFNDIKTVEFDRHNCLNLALKNDEYLLIQGNNKENLYIIYDLIKIFKETKN